MVSGLVRARFEVLRDIYDVTRAQRRALEVDDVERFRVLLEERAHLIEQLHELEQQDEALPQNVVTFPGAEANPQDDELALDTLLHGILEQDRANEALLHRRMDEVRAEIPSLNVARRAAVGYRTAHWDGLRAVDRIS